MADNSKDVIYIDIDDEITAVIDKVRASDGRIIALVLPKRASVFQSIVNMKLLKRAADDAKKRLVLITSEAGLLPLAGAVGLHVAKTLQSKPAIPASPDAVEAEETVDEDEPVDVSEAGDKPIGELAGAAAAAPLATDDAMETVELDNDDTLDEASKASAAPLPLAAKKKDKKFKIPNFDRFRLWLVIGVVALIALIVFLYLAIAVLPKATIAITTNASNVNTNATVTLDTNASSLNLDSKTVPAKKVQEQKTYSQQVATTGQQNNGDKATGNVTMTACESGFSYPQNVPSGTGISAGGLTYITQSTVSFSPAGPDSAHSCYKYTSSSVAIKALKGGANYNVSSGTSFSVPGRSDVSASGSASGGTDNIVQVVSQTDIDNATKQIKTDDNGVKTDLQNQLRGQNLYALGGTFNAGPPSTTSSAQVGDTANNVTVTETITYIMYGAKQSDLKAVLDNNIKSQIDTTKQSILSEGLNNAQVKVVNSTDNTDQINIQTTAVVGPQLDVNSIKQAAVGQKSGEIVDAVKSNPGVTDVSVHMSPFWVTKAPKASKITVTIAKPTNTVNANNP